MKKNLIWIVLLAAVLLVEGAAQVANGNSAVRAAAIREEKSDSAETVPVNCRYGVNNLSGLDSNQWIAPIGAGFWLDFQPTPKGPPVPPELEHIPQVRMQQAVSQGQFLPSRVITPALDFGEKGLGTQLMQGPGRLWLVGNEVDVNSPVQDRMTPQMYAETYHDVYHFIKSVDPTAYVANAGLSMMTPGRMQYMDIVWDTYLDLYGEEMPVDVWNFHLYILSERDLNNESGQGDGKIAIGTDPALAKIASNGTPNQCPLDEIYCRAETDSMEIFKEQVVNMRQWMKDHGQQNKPLILSEYSILYPFVDYDDPVNPTECFLMDEYGNCFTQARVSSYMQQTMAYLATETDPDLGYPDDDYKLVQQWKWYSMFTYPTWSGGSSNLLLDNYGDFADGDLAALTQVGQTFRTITAEQETFVNLGAGDGSTTVLSAESDGTVSAPISVGFFNNGTTGVVDPFTVTFYADEALTQEIASAVISADTHGVVNGCAWGRNTDRATVMWPDLPVGTHRFWVKIDSTNAISAETDESDNVTSGTVQVYPNGNYLPVVQR